MKIGTTRQLQLRDVTTTVDGEIRIQITDSFTWTLSMYEARKLSRVLDQRVRGRLGAGFFDPGGQGEIECVIPDENEPRPGLRRSDPMKAN